MLPNFEGKMYKTGTNCNIMTKDGASAVQELIEFLNKAGPLEPLEWIADMSSACRDLCVDNGPKGLHGHVCQDGRSFSDRLKKYGHVNGQNSESISYMQKQGRDVVI